MSGVAVGIGMGVAGLGTVASSVIGAKAANDAAGTQADAIVQAQLMTKESADAARIEILGRINPALRKYNESIKGQQTEIRNGAMNVLNSIRSTHESSSKWLQTAQTQAQGEVRAGAENQLSHIAGYQDAGAQAAQQEAAITGALGPEAQKAAIQAYSESPGQEYLRNQQEQSLLRNASAIGGLGGGRVRTALQEQAMGIASTNQQQHIDNLRSIASRGLSASETAVGIEGTSSAQLANIAQQLGVSQSQLTQMMGAQESQTLASMSGDTLATLRDRANMGMNTETNLAQVLANLATQTGSTLGNLETQKGSALASGQMAAGQSIAQGVSGLAGIAGTGIMLSPQMFKTPMTSNTSPGLADYAQMMNINN